MMDAPVAVDTHGTSRFTRDEKTTLGYKSVQVPFPQTLEDGGGPVSVKKQDGPSPFDYICVDRPAWDDKRYDDWYEFEHDWLLTNIDASVYPKLELDIPDKLAADDPDWKWSMMRYSHDMVAEWRSRTNYCEPELFGIFLYNDFFAYGLQELQEDVLVQFDEEFRKDDRSFRGLWAIMAGMMHWQLHERSNWSPHNNGEKTSETIGLVGCAFLTLLNEVQQAGQLGPDSLLKDLDLIMCMTLEWTRGQATHGIRDRDLVWREYVVAYAKKGKIDLDASPLHNTSDLLRSLKHSRKRVGHARTDRWGWRRKFDQFTARHGARGNDVRAIPGDRAYDTTQTSGENWNLVDWEAKESLAAMEEEDAGECRLAITLEGEGRSSAM